MTRAYPTKEFSPSDSLDSDHTARLKRFEPLNILLTRQLNHKIQDGTNHKKKRNVECNHKLCRGSL